MKKKFLVLLSVLILSSAMAMAQTKYTTNPDLSAAIKLYKAGNYTECYVKLNSAIKKDPANALAYYYMAMTATHLGRQDDAIENYDKAINLTSKNNNLYRYATKGKRCLETPDKCEESVFESAEDEFILNRNNTFYSESVQGEIEKLKIENLMREINRSGDIDPQKFKEYKDFSSYDKNLSPTNDEIVAALRTLQKAGLGNIINSNTADLSILTDRDSQNSMLNMLGGNSSLNPQLIQALLTNNMTQGF